MRYSKLHIKLSIIFWYEWCKQQFRPILLICEITTKNEAYHSPSPSWRCMHIKQTFMSNIKLIMINNILWYKVWLIAISIDTGSVCNDLLYSLWKVKQHLTHGGSLIFKGLQIFGAFFKKWGNRLCFYFPKHEHLLWNHIF